MGNPNPSLDRGYILNIIQGIFLALAFASLAARLYVRTRITKNLGWDDFFIVLATVNSLHCSLVDRLTKTQDHCFSRTQHEHDCRTLWTREAYRRHKIGRCDLSSHQVGLCPITSSGTSCHVHKDIHLHFLESGFREYAYKMDMEVDLTLCQCHQHFSQYNLCRYGTCPMHTRSKTLEPFHTWNLLAAKKAN